MRSEEEMGRKVVRRIVSGSSNRHDDMISVARRVGLDDDLDAADVDDEGDDDDESILFLLL